MTIVDSVKALCHLSEPNIYIIPPKKWLTNPDLVLYGLVYSVRFGAKFIYNPCDNSVDKAHITYGGTILDAGPASKEEYTEVLRIMEENQLNV